MERENTGERIERRKNGCEKRGDKERREKKQRKEKAKKRQKKYPMMEEERTSIKEGIRESDKNKKEQNRKERK